VLRTIGVITFLLSIASPYDDGIQQEFLRPKSRHVALRRLPSATHGIRKSEVVAQIVVPANKSPMPIWFGSVTSAKVAARLICFCSTLIPRSPPAVLVRLPI
jgi:hypothetical protein